MPDSAGTLLLEFLETNLIDGSAGASFCLQIETLVVVWRQIDLLEIIAFLNLQLLSNGICNDLTNLRFTRRLYRHRYYLDVFEFVDADFREIRAVHEEQSPPVDEVVEETLLTDYGNVRRAWEIIDSLTR